MNNAAHRLHSHQL